MRVEDQGRAALRRVRQSHGEVVRNMEEAERQAGEERDAADEGGREAGGLDTDTAHVEVLRGLAESHGEEVRSMEATHEQELREMRIRQPRAPHAPLSSENGTGDKVNAILWPWLLGEIL
jgi:hypothetical protein